MFEHSLWWLGMLLEAAILIRGWREKLVSRFPLFYSYLLTVLIQDVISIHSLPFVLPATCLRKYLLVDAVCQPGDGLDCRLRNLPPGASGVPWNRENGPHSASGRLCGSFLEARDHTSNEFAQLDKEHVREAGERPASGAVHCHHHPGGVVPVVCNSAGAKPWRDTAGVRDVRGGERGSALDRLLLSNASATFLGHRTAGLLHGRGRVMDHEIVGL